MYPTEKLHEEIKVEWLGVSQAKSSCIEMYKYLNDICPITVTQDVNLYAPNRALRSASSHTIVKCKTKTKFAEKDVGVRGARYWDLLDTDTKTSNSLNRIKNVVTSIYQPSRMIRIYFTSGILCQNFANWYPQYHEFSSPDPSPNCEFVFQVHPNTF